MHPVGPAQILDPLDKILLVIQESEINRGTCAKTIFSSNINTLWYVWVLWSSSKLWFVLKVVILLKTIITKKSAKALKSLDFEQF